MIKEMLPDQPEVISKGSPSEAGNYKRMAIALAISAAIVFSTKGFDITKNTYDEWQESLALEELIEANTSKQKFYLNKIDSEITNLQAAINNIPNKEFKASLKKQITDERIKIEERMSNYLNTDAFDERAKGLIDSLNSKKTEVMQEIQKRDLVAQYPSYFENYKKLYGEYRQTTKWRSHADFKYYNTKQFYNVSNDMHFDIVKQRVDEIKAELDKLQKIIENNYLIGTPKKVRSLLEKKTNNVISKSEPKQQIVSVAQIVKPVAKAVKPVAQAAEPVTESVAKPVIEAKPVDKKPVNTVKSEPLAIKGSLTVKVRDEAGNRINGVKIYLLGIKESYSHGVKLPVGKNYRIKVKAPSMETVVKTINLNQDEKTVNVTMKPVLQAVIITPIFAENGKRFSVNDGKLMINGKPYRKGMKLKAGKYKLQFEHNTFENKAVELTVANGKSDYRFDIQKRNAVKDLGNSIFGLFNKKQ
ncbi:hypothetical protein ACTL6P_15450 [Endozoicomonas acroporae]|uniref:hypothetical protein n=1 Tax=Endozoicomonas acroporae TaxID=1701104 RepID=UPI000C75769C|nr:hypothetical protein [Endozoicomonas acroporae]